MDRDQRKVILDQLWNARIMYWTVSLVLVSGVTLVNMISCVGAPITGLEAWGEASGRIMGAAGFFLGGLSFIGLAGVTSWLARIVEALPDRKPDDQTSSS